MRRHGIGQGTAALPVQPRHDTPAAPLRRSISHPSTSCVRRPLVTDVSDVRVPAPPCAALPAAPLRRPPLAARRSSCSVRAAVARCARPRV
jgi:hypothetical protein